MTDTERPGNRRVLAFELNDPGSFDIRTEARPDPRLVELEARVRTAEEALIRRQWDLDTAIAQILELSGQIVPQARLAELLAAAKEAAWMLDQCHALQDATRLRVAVAAFEEGK